MSRVLKAMLVVLAVLAAGCSVPDHGDIHVTTLERRGGDDDVIPYNPAGPTRGASPTRIVDGFIEAMKAAPINTSDAKKFLTDQAAAAWDPSRRTIVYGELGSRGDGGRITLRATQGDWLDDRGVWRGRLPATGTDLPFRLTKVAGEWRISSAPDALVVEDSWFESHFARSLLYYFDPSGRFLVPEPVFAPRGAQYASALVNSLLTGPGAAERRSVRTYLPSTASEVLSVPVRDRTAEIDLTNAGHQSPQALHLMAAQLAWTLRQDDSVDRVRLTLDGNPVAFEDSGSAFHVRTTGQGYDPNGFGSADDLYGVRDGRVVDRRGSGAFTPVKGAWGEERHDITSVSVQPGAASAAAVARDGRTLLTGPINGNGDVDHVPLQATRLLHGSWDLSNRFWLIDATASGARVLSVLGTHATSVTVPGVTGQDVRRFLVSRDGTRLVALIHGPTRDRIVVSRLRSSPVGEVTSASPAITLSLPDTVSSAEETRFTDIAWTSPTTIVAAEELTRSTILQPLSTDGSTLGVAGETPTVSEKVTGLVGSPADSARLYVLSGSHLIDPTDSAAVPLGSNVTGITYQG